MVDEATIKKLQKQLAKKQEEANRRQDEFYKAAEKVKLTENEIEFLKEELDNERRKSTADQNRIRQYEQILTDKQRKLEEAEN